MAISPLQISIRDDNWLDSRKYLFILFTLGLFGDENILNLIREVKDKLLTHPGSIDLQHQLERDHLILPTIILHEIETNYTQVCLNTYGNYVCQKLISKLSASQLLRLLDCLSEDFETIAKSIPGSCIVSEMINASINEKNCEVSLLKMFEAHVCALICDSQGSHLLQQVVVLFDSTRSKFILDLIKENFHIISTDKYGCCLIKKIIERFDDDEIFIQVKSDLLYLSNVRSI